MPRDSYPAPGEAIRSSRPAIVVPLLPFKAGPVRMTGAGPGRESGGDGVAYADLLIELRTERGLSQEALAERAGVSVRAISDLERGITGRPHRRTVRALADGLGITGAERTGFEEAAAAVGAPLARGRAAPQIRLPAPVSSIIGRY